MPTLFVHRQLVCLCAESEKSLQNVILDPIVRATEHNQDMIVLLQDLKGRVAKRDRQQIENLLAQVVDDVSDAATRLDPPRSSHHDDTQGEAVMLAEAGSGESMDIVDEDILQNQEARATGYVGRSSELRWLRRLWQNMAPFEEVSLQTEGPYGPPGDKTDAISQHKETLTRRQQKDSVIRVPTSASTFYLDNNNINVDLTVNMFELPPRETAKTLLNSYMITVQGSFPFLSETSFRHQFDQYYNSVLYGTPCSLSHRWLALLNLVFAIGTKYLRLLETVCQPEDQDHHIYYSRGHMLGIDGFSLVGGHPDLLEIQLTALLAFYFLSIGHVNRSWVVIGHSLRYAHALGLHVRNENRAATVLQKEILLRMWWGLYSLERNVSTIVGRPSCVLDDFCSVPLPLPLGVEQLSDDTLAYESQKRYSLSTLQIGSTTAERSNSGSYLNSRVQIDMIRQKAMIELYSATVVTKSWKHVQRSISRLREQLEVWSVSLPPGFKFSQTNIDTSFKRERLILHMWYIGTKILLTRPCLCRLDTRTTNQMKAADDFNRQTARTCVGAAMAMADLLPDNVDIVYLYKTGPWWCVVHNLMQALVTLLLEMSFGTVDLYQDGKEILSSAKKLIRWLRMMAKNNPIAERAYTVAFGVLQRLASKFNADISDIIQEDTVRTAFISKNQFGEHHQASEIQGMNRDDSNDDQTGFASMFILPIAQPNDDTSSMEHYSQTYRQFDPISENPFVSVHDQKSFDASGENPFGMNAIFPGFWHQQPPTERDF
ncbi:hypothetical protein N0V90_007084 [Kalmusia sp. IMI 367209]|nr:hypothetical protein N0V90_007084 [Kalmusia sp. IMI 367209]